jgi:hypothetical protein
MIPLCARLLGALSVSSASSHSAPALHVRKHILFRKITPIFFLLHILELCALACREISPEISPILLAPTKRRGNLLLTDD